jgi:predicted permease
MAPGQPSARVRYPAFVGTGLQTCPVGAELDSKRYELSRYFRSRKMNVFIAAFKSVAVLMGIGIVGFIILARKTVPLDVLRVLSPLVLEVALPCLIFYNIITRFNPAQMPDWWQLPLWWVGMIAFFLILTIIGIQFVNREFKAEAGISLFYPNATFFPIGIIPIIYGPDTILLVQLFIFTLFMPVIVFNGYSFFFRSTKAGRKFSFRDSRILNPVLVATILAIGLKLTDTDALLPDFIITIIGIIGATALPLLMMTIGGNVYVDFKRRGKFNFKSSAKFVIAKNILFPAATLGMILLVKPPPSIATLIIIQAAVPPLSALPVLTERAEGNVALVNQFLISSFMFSILTIPLSIWCFGILYR